MMPNVVIIHHSPFANEEADDQEPRHHAQDGSEYGRLIDLHIAKAEAEVRFWQAHKAEDERAASKAAAEGERISQQIRKLCPEGDEGDEDGK
jgi:hypothetical protein